MVAHLRPAVSNLKATFVFLRSIFSRLLYDITSGDCKQGPRLHVWAPIQPSSISSTIFLSLHHLINVLYALWCCIIHQTKWPGSVHRQLPRLPSLPLTHSPTATMRGRIFFIFCQLEIFSDKVITLPTSPFWMSNTVSSKGNNKGVQATWVASRLFWSGRLQ